MVSTRSQHVIRRSPRTVSKSKAPQQKESGKKRTSSPVAKNQPPNTPTVKKRRTGLNNKANPSNALNPQITKKNSNPTSPKNASQTAALVAPPSSPSKTKSPPVDKDIGLFFSTSLASNFTVVKDANDEWYDVVLNQCNITGSNNNNKYYRLQLLKSSTNEQFYVWMKWGRVGEVPKASAKDLKGPFSNVEAAHSAFAKKFKDKTGNSWGAHSSFVPKQKKYTRIEIDHDANMNEDDLKMAKAVKKDVKYLPCSLDPKTKELIEMIFSKDMRDDALSSYNLDLKRLPLGVPSQQQIQTGVAILNEIEDKLNGGDVPDSFNELSSRFYTAIPHSFGRSRPPTISSKESLQQRYDMTNVLLDMFSTNEVVRKVEEEETALNTKLVPSPIDSHYKTLQADLSFVDKDGENFQQIQQYFNKTKSSGKLLDVWQMNRKGEKERYQKFDSLQNRKLLWHGTNIAVVAPIITSGLRIMPHSGGRVGSGIYLASMQEKSAGYTSGYGRKACMFLCETALGKEFKVTRDGCHASSLKKAPQGSDSVHAIGTTAPQSWSSMNIDGKEVKVPTSSGANSGVSSSFYHDEFLVYDEAQVRLRYVLTVELYS